MTEIASEVKTYTVIYGPTWWECTISIDHSFVFENISPGEHWPMAKALEEMVIFWSDGKKRLALNDGDVVKTFLQQLAREINYIQAVKDYNLEGVIEEFVNREGWWVMDGSNGITIVDIDDFDFAYNEYEVMEVPVS